VAKALRYEGSPRGSSLPGLLALDDFVDEEAMVDGRVGQGNETQNFLSFRYLVVG
jgi:hypothetical protein